MTRMWRVKITALVWSRHAHTVTAPEQHLVCFISLEELRDRISCILLALECFVECHASSAFTSLKKYPKSLEVLRDNRIAYVRVHLFVFPCNVIPPHDSISIFLEGLRDNNTMHGSCCMGLVTPYIWLLMSAIVGFESCVLFFKMCRRIVWQEN